MQHSGAFAHTPLKIASSKRSTTVLYGGKKARVESACGLRVLLVRVTGGEHRFLVHKNHGKFDDYLLRRSDLEIIIPDDAEALLYRVGQYTTLVFDHR